MGGVVEHLDHGAGTRTAKIVVKEVLRGTAPSTLELSIGGECDATLEVNRDYLVYATRRQGLLTTSGCSRTRPVEEASDDLAYIRSPQRSRSVASLYGVVKVTETGPDDVRATSPFRLILAGAKGNRAIFIGDTTGSFEILDFAPGDYRVRVDGPVVFSNILAKGRTPDMIRVRAGACQNLGVFELRLR